MKKIIIFLIAFTIASLSAYAQETENYAHLTVNNCVRDIVNHPVFKGFGELLLTFDDNTPYYDIRLSDVASRIPYHQSIDAPVMVNTLNYMIDEVSSGKTIFYGFYTPEQIRQDRAKEKTGIFFFRGEPDAPFAIMCPGGAFAQVSSLQEGFPIAWEISKNGYNAFVIRYRVGGERIACEDLAAAIAWIFVNAPTLEVSTKDYSLWGFSAGARMAARLASHGTAAYGAGDCPKPGTAVIAFTGHTDFTANDPPTLTIAGERDGIAPPRIMGQRVNAMKAAGIDTEFHVYRDVGHGFGLGIGTSGEGWVDTAVRFWEKYIK
jgi:acetyl esterase/lipase